MSETAMILPFPRRPDPARDPARRSLAALEAALGEQAAAVADWRASLGTLAEALAGLHGSLHGHGTALRDLAERVGDLHDESLRLQHWADRVGAV